MAQINDKYCNCDYGRAILGTGYPSYGTSLDYAFDMLDIEYSFAWEIFTPLYINKEQVLKIRKKNR